MTQVQTTPAVELTYTDGVLNWRKGNTYLPDLTKEDFLVHGNGVEKYESKEQFNAIKKQFYTYMAMFKTDRAIKFKTMADELFSASAEYTKKANNIGKELSPEEVLAEKKAKLLKQLEALNATAEAQGIEI